MAEIVILPVIIYLRVSTEEQARRGFSIPEQREAARRKAEELAGELERTSGARVELQIREFLDDFGGDILERPVLEDVRAFLKNHQVRYFICLDPDRFARSLMLQLVVTDEIEKAGTQLVFVQHNYEKTPEGQLFYQMRGAISQFEKAKILERTSRGRKGKIKAGRRPNGAAPYGYRHNKVTDELEIEETEARWVRAIFEWSARNQLGPAEIARQLNDLGVPTKRDNGKWYRGVVRRMLLNPTYIGEMYCNRTDFRGLGAIRRLPREKRRPLSAKTRPPEEWIVVPVPPVIDRDIWDAVQRVYAQTQRGKRGKRQPPGLLSLLVKCGVCGRNMHYTRNNGGQHGRRAYFKCKARYTDDYRPGTPTCSNPHHWVAPIEEGVWNQLVLWLTQPDLVEEYLSAGTNDDQVADQVRRLQEHRTVLGEQLAGKQREQVIIIRHQAQGLITDELAGESLKELKRQIDSIQGAIARLEQEIGRLEPKLTAVQATIQGFKDLASAIADECRDIRDRLAALTAEQRRELILKLVRSVTLFADGTWRIDPH